MTSPVFSNHHAASRFEYVQDGHTAFADYRREGSTLYIDYVEAPPPLRGTGAAGKLMQAIYDVATAENLDIVPICGYAASWIKRHTE